MRGRQEILASLAWCSWVSTWLAAATHSKGLTLSLAFLLSLFSSHPPHDLLSIFLPLFSPNPNPLTSSLLFLLLLLLLLPFSLPPRHRDPPCCTTTLLSLTSTPPPFPASLPCPSSDCSKKLQNETSSTRWVLMCERLSFFCSRVGLSWRKMILGCWILLQFRSLVELTVFAFNLLYTCWIDYRQALVECFSCFWIART